VRVGSNVDAVEDRRLVAVQCRLREPDDFVRPFGHEQVPVSRLDVVGDHLLGVEPRVHVLGDGVLAQQVVVRRVP